MTLVSSVEGIDRTTLCFFGLRTLFLLGVAACLGPLLAVISGEVHWDLVRVPSELERLESFYVDSGQLVEGWITATLVFKVGFF